ncbi:MAG: hybrid sensor histidine kinase/response regulator [Acidobacteria bacterium]|nr:hybrid sensor histidine kinase/response regulator [Acidobacteriota bacterium]
MEDKYKILIIDDEEVVLDSCTQILEGGNYQIATAADGSLGLQLAQEFQPDLVYVDLKMPGISGFEVLEKIRAVDPTMVTIVITGYATVSSAVEAMKKGAYDFLPKPFTPDEFRLITQRGLEKRRLVLETMALRREKEMLREHFAAIVSHELKSPLSAIQQNLFVVAEELSSKLTERQKSRFERMKSRIDDLLKLIHTWLRVMSVDISKIKERFEPISVVSSIATAIESVQPQAMRKDIEIVTSVEEPLRPVDGDEGSLTEALVNIIGNAIKYSYVGSTVFVRAEEKEDNVLISVSDTGVGISKEELPLIFDDFYSGKAGQAVERGSGLGLAITRRIIEAHNGSVSVESELGKGSTFVICLPALQIDLHNQPSLKTDLLANSQHGGVA